MKKQKRVIVSSGTYVPGVCKGGYEINNSPSMTKPNESLSIKQIIDRFGQGIPDTTHEYPYFDEEDLEKIDHYFAPGSLDLTDITALKERVEVLNEVVSNAVKAKKELDAAEKAAEEEKEKDYRKKVEAYDKQVKAMNKEEKED